MPRTITYGTRLRALGGSIALVFGAFILGNILLIATAIVLEALGVPIFGRPGRLLFLSTVLLQGITFGGIALIYLKVRDLGLGFIRARIPDLRDAGIVVGGIVALFALLIVANVVLSSLGIESATNQIIEIGQQNPTVFLLLIPLSYLLIGPGEELFFRGLVQGSLMESYRPVVAILLASGLFAMPHVFSLSGQGKIVSVSIVFLLALVLGASYVYSENIVVPSVIHGTFNAVQFGGAYLFSTGAL